MRRKYWIEVKEVFPLRISPHPNGTFWAGWLYARDRLGRLYSVDMYHSNAPDRLGAILDIHRQAQAWVNKRPNSRQLQPLFKGEHDGM